ncbi:DUF6711 family protein [Clostridium sp. Mt-5]|uniref:DUF6711 family protein n=1 Tax=Clostridium moutaii TaxID=3240932 RepID=A0ABV4BU33_9CLOT
MLKINGVELPDPSTYNPSIQDISNAQRNARGEMILERIATKRKLSLSWAFLSGTDTLQLLSLVSSTFFSVEYIDPQDGGLKSGTFYSGDRTMTGIMYKDGIMYYKDVKFDIIER